MTQILPLGEIAAINPATPVKLSSDDMCAFVPMDAVDEVTADITRFTYRPYRDVAKSYTTFAKDDILLAKITPCMENGKCAIARRLKGAIGFGSTEFHVIRPSPQVLPEWIYYFWRQSQTRELAARNMTGSAGQKRVPTNFLEELLVPIPSLHEQERSVRLLNVADGLRHMRRCALQMCDELLPAVFLEIFGDPRLNSKKWCSCTIDDALEWSQYGTSQKSNTTKTGYPVLGMANLTTYGLVDLNSYAYVDLSAEEFEQLKLQRGDIIFNRTNSTELVGKTACWCYDLNAVVASYLVRLRLKPGIEPQFFAALLNTSYFKRLFQERCKKAVGQSNISPTLLKEFPMYLPPERLQRKFTEIVDRQIKLRAPHIEALRQADHLFQTLLHQAFRS